MQSSQINNCSDPRDKQRELMKIRESGMPVESVWEKFFDVSRIFSELEVEKDIKKLVDFGAGYGTFSIPAGKVIKGEVLSYEIEPNLIADLKSKIKEENQNNIELVHRDFIESGSGLPNDHVDYVFLFNILHASESEYLLEETRRILKYGGKVGVIHWNYDSSTPRGPSMKIRPKAEDLEVMLQKKGFTILRNKIDLPPYHYGILAKK